MFIIEVLVIDIYIINIYIKKKTIIPEDKISD